MGKFGCNVLNLVKRTTFTLQAAPNFSRSKGLSGEVQKVKRTFLLYTPVIFPLKVIETFSGLAQSRRRMG